MAFCWVNHKQTRDHEVRGGYLWSPMDANGAFNQTYENMRLVRPGDIVFSYANGRIGAIGRVTKPATACPKPDAFGTVGDYWSNEGWMVEVDFRPAPRPLNPKQEIEAIGPLLPQRYSPLQSNGNGNQGCYLAAISEALGHLLLALLDADGVSDDVLSTVEFEASGQRRRTQRHPQRRSRRLAHRHSTSAIGKGAGRARLVPQAVILLDQACGVTGVTDTRVLVASHIKPWREASNAERINGHNGILLSPHVDALSMKSSSPSRTMAGCRSTHRYLPTFCIAGP